MSITSFTSLERVRVQNVNLWLRMYGEQQGMDFDIMREFFIEGKFGKEVLTLPYGATVFDVGAHVGIYSILVKNLRPDLEVYAFEPEPENYGLLVKNIDESGYDIYAIQCAVNYFDEPVFLNFLGNSGGWCGIPHDFAERVIPVRGVRLEKLCRMLGVEKVDWIKMDVEGMEHDIIEHLPPSFLERVGGLDLELHPPLSDIKRTVSILEEFGFKCKWSQEKELICLR
jgi:FkbM family methyltransferase